MRRIVVLAVVISVFCFCSGLAALAQIRPSRPVPVIEAPSARLPEQSTPLRPVERRELPSRSALEIAPADVPRIILPALDATRLRQERDQRQRLRQQEDDQLLNRPPSRGFRLPEPQKQEIGINRDLRLSAVDGKWFPLPAARVWMLDITSPGSLTTRLHFTNFALPPGMKLYVSAPGANQEPAEFEDKGQFPSGDFWSPPVAGDTVHVELLDESSSDSPPPADLPFEISGLGHVYDDPMAYDFGEPALCERDAACYPDWSNVGDSVARILFSNGPYIFACSAVLINNLTGDFSPLLLTANHCISTDALAHTVTAYWFYKSSSCNGPANVNQALISTMPPSLPPTRRSTTAIRRWCRSSVHCPTLWSGRLGARRNPVSELR